jgi:tetratricopeptide (TPR) repeat protein
MRRLALFALLLWTALPGENRTPYEDAFESFKRGKFVDAQRKLEELLKSNPNNPTAWALLGDTIFEAEGDILRSYRCHSRAKKLCDRGLCETNQHSYIVDRLAVLAGLRDEYSEQVQLLDLAERIDGYSRDARKGWPIMKLGRVAEARRLMEQLVTVSDERRLTAMNTLGSMDFEMGDFDASYQWFDKMRDEHVGDLGDQIVFQTNYAEIAMILGRFDEAERVLVRAAAHPAGSSSANPLFFLTELYTQEGRLAEAISAAQRMVRWHRASPPYIFQQHSSTAQFLSALLALAAGHHELGLSITRRQVTRPDRRGTISSKSYQAEASFLQIHEELLHQASERAREEFSWSTWRERAQQLPARASLEWELWTTQRQLDALIRRNGPLRILAQPNHPVDTPEWIRPAHYRALGCGPSRAVLEQLLRRDDKRGPRERPYVLAALGEAQVACGDTAAGLQNLKQALPLLPKQEALLQARARAFLARAFEQQGQREPALQLYQQTMDTSPPMARLARLQLPVQIQASDALARQVAGRLYDSPRFRKGNGFVIRVQTSGKQLSAVLLSSNGTVYAYASAPVTKDQDATIAQLCKSAHERFFAAKVDLAQLNTLSLDGATNSGSISREMLEGFMNFSRGGAQPLR